MKKKQTKALKLGKSSIKTEDSVPGGHSKLLKQVSTLLLFFLFFFFFTLLLKVKAHLKNVQVISWNAIKFSKV